MMNSERNEKINNTTYYIVFMIIYE
jgi:hypothetical protein